MRQEEQEDFNEQWWKNAAWFFPLVWIWALNNYFENDGCFSNRGITACGWQAILMLLVLFLGVAYFPYFYFRKVRPQVLNRKKNEEKEINKIFKDEKNWK